MSPRAGICALTIALMSHTGSLLGAVAWRDVLQQPAEWYATAEARGIADTVLLYQDASGGWPKNRDMTLPPPARPTPPDSVTATSEPTIDHDHAAAAARPGLQRRG